MLKKPKEEFKCQICIDQIGKSAKYTRTGLKNHAKIAHKPKIIIGDEKK